VRLPWFTAADRIARATLLSMKDCMSSRQTGIGFAGPGWIGQAQLRKLAARDDVRDDVRIGALFSPHAEKAFAILDELGLSRSLYVASFSEMLSRPEVDAVWIASPNGFHGQQALAALRAGKHVFCEKPCATDFQDYREQLALAQAQPALVTMIDYILYFDPLERRIRAMVEEGAFGHLSQVQVNYRHPVNTSEGRTWKFRRDTMGDAIGMGIVHALSVMLWIFEANGQKPTAVYATSARAQIRPFEVDPVWNIVVRFDGGGTGFCFGNIESGNGYDAYHNLFGTEGAFVFDPGQRPEQRVRYWSKARAAGEWIWPMDVDRCNAAGLAEYAWPREMRSPDSGDVLSHSIDESIEEFLSHIRAGTQSALSFGNSSIIAEVGWAAQLSALTRSEVPLPLDVQAAAEKLAAAKQ